MHMEFPATTPDRNRQRLPPLAFPFHVTCSWFGQTDSSSIKWRLIPSSQGWCIVIVLIRSLTTQLNWVSFPWSLGAAFPRGSNVITEVAIQSVSVYCQCIHVYPSTAEIEFSQQAYKKKYMCVVLCSVVLCVCVCVCVCMCACVRAWVRACVNECVVWCDVV